MDETDTSISDRNTIDHDHGDSDDGDNDVQESLSDASRDALSSIDDDDPVEEEIDLDAELAQSQARLAAEGEPAQAQFEAALAREDVVMAQEVVTPEAPEITDPAATDLDPVTTLAQTGTAEEARDYMAAHPEEIGDVLEAFAENRPGMVPELVEVSGDVILELAPEEIPSQKSGWNRAWGALRAVGGAIEAAAGAAVVVLPEPFVVTDLLGGAAVVHGGDNFQAGVRQAWTGEVVESGTELASETLAEALGADPATAELIGDGVDIALGLGLGSVSGIRSLSNLAARTGTVWDNIRPTGAMYQGTVVPQSFELSTGATRFADSVWVHPNGSKHIAERATAMTSRLVPQELANLSAQLQLHSMQRAVTEAVQGGVPLGQTVEVAGWQLAFGAGRQADELPVLIHAITLDYIR